MIYLYKFNNEARPRQGRSSPEPSNDRLAAKFYTELSTKTVDRLAGLPPPPPRRYSLALKRRPAVPAAPRLAHRSPPSC